MQHLPAQIALPGRHGLTREQGVEAFKEIRRGHIERGEVPDADGAEVHLPIERRRQFLEVVHGVDVVDLFRIAPVHTGHGGFGQRGFDIHYRPSFFGGFVGRVAGQSKHLLDVLDVGGADLGKVRRIDQVVIAIGQGDAALVGLGDLL